MKLTKHVCNRHSPEEKRGPKYPQGSGPRECCSRCNIRGLSSGFLAIDFGNEGKYCEKVLAFQIEG
jgi:hypothetical protein